MNNPDEAANNYPILSCSEIIYRAMRSKSWLRLDTREVLPAAFIRRPRPKDADGVSVSPASICSIEETRNKLNKCYGVVSLHVGRVRDIGLDVQQNGPDHASIVDIPYQEDDPLEAERLAGLLARQSRIQWPE